MSNTLKIYPAANSSDFAEFIGEINTDNFFKDDNIVNEPVNYFNQSEKKNLETVIILDV